VIHLSGSPVVPAQLTPNPSVPGNPEHGRQLFTDARIYPPNGCGTCHTLLNVSSGVFVGAAGGGAQGTISAPNLTNIALRPTLANDALQNTPEQMRAWIADAPSQKPTTAMPNLHLSPEDAQDIVAFLYSYPYNPER
jgi:mono/diheme cytochrome c family protein